MNQKNLTAFQIIKQATTPSPFDTSAKSLAKGGPLQTDNT